jgi:ABC-type transport system substrate-binding protein
MLGLLSLALFLVACSNSPLNSPYSDEDNQLSVLYSSFSERPKHLDPAVSYNSNEYTFIAQIYEPLFQYHYLLRPYQLTPLTAAAMPVVQYLDSQGQALPSGSQDEAIIYTEYLLSIKPNIQYQPHPALAKDVKGNYIYHRLTTDAISRLNTLYDLPEAGSRELIADDYIYQIKRLADPKIQSPIAEIMKNYIVGFDEFSKIVAKKQKAEIKTIDLTGVSVVNRYQYKIRIKGKYPQFMFWLAMPFFSPMPWEADAFYEQPGLADKNIKLDWYPIGTGAYLLAENNPNRRMVLSKNPLFHEEFYPAEGEVGDQQKGLLKDAGKALPFIDKEVFILEKESIPYWNKFLQGYYDASGIASDSFDQAIQFTAGGNVALTEDMIKKGIKLETAVTTSIYYLGFNMLDTTVGGNTESARKLRLAIAIAVDYEEYISIFTNGRGVPAQGLIPPGIYGNAEGEAGINPYVYDWVDGKPRRKPLQAALQLMQEAGYANGIDPKTKAPLVLHFDTTAVAIDDRPRLNWYRKQFEKIGIKLDVRGTDYNRFQEKMRTGNAQLFNWGWNADYPDPENFFFLLFGPNSKVSHGGENAGNYQNPEFDRLFEKMRNMENSEQRFQIIQQMQDIIRRDCAWLFGYHPKGFTLYHSWYHNLKPNLMANNQLKYTRIDDATRAKKRAQWNQPIVWPLFVVLFVLASMILPAINAFRHRSRQV